MLKKVPRAGAISMTEVQFLQNLEFYQRQFEKLHRSLVNEMNLYMRQTRFYDSSYYRKILNYSVYITLTGAWIKLLKDFNSDKYNNILRFSIDFNNGVPDYKANTSPQGSGKTDE